MNISKNFIINSTKGEIVWDNKIPPISSVCIDSRRIKENELFIALKGENFDGHNYVKEAFEKGASAAIVENIPNNISGFKEKLLIKVVSTKKGLIDLAKSWRDSFKNLKVAAITGSNGKTTTKEMAYSILSVNHSVLKNSGNFNNDIGLPLTLLNLTDQHEICVVELGMNDFGEIRLLTDISKPDVGAITSIGRAHLEKLGDIEGVAKAKSELVENFNEKNTFCVNIDDPHILRISEKINCNKINYSLESQNADIWADDIIKDGFKSISFKLNIGNNHETVRIRGIGIHNVLNSLCASAISHTLGCTLDEIQAGLERYQPSQMRLEVIESPQGFKILNDAYNANPDSMIKGIDELVTHKSNNKIIAILGDMLELGKNSHNEHRNIGKYLSKSKVDIVITIGEESKYIVEGLNGTNKGYCAKDHEEASNLLINLAGRDDVVLVKGSRGMKMENVIQNLFKV